jgi:hypothetical protein
VYIKCYFGNLGEMYCLRNLRHFYQEDGDSEEFQQACAMYADTGDFYFENFLQFQKYKFNVNGRCLLVTLKFEVTLIFIPLL